MDVMEMRRRDWIQARVQMHRLTPRLMRETATVLTAEPVQVQVAA